MSIVVVSKRLPCLSPIHSPKFLYSKSNRDFQDQEEEKRGRRNKSEMKTPIGSVADIFAMNFAVSIVGNQPKRILNLKRRESTIMSDI